jgi:hypothetical protein
MPTIDKPFSHAAEARPVQKLFVFEDASGGVRR